MGPREGERLRAQRHAVNEASFKFLVLSFELVTQLRTQN